MPSMKPTLFAAALLTAGAAHAAPPVITITTPAQFSGSKAIISGTATDTEESTGGGGTGGGTTTVLGPGGVREVLYQYEGESKWRKTTVTAKGELTTTWIAEVSLKVGSTKRIYFMAVDKGGNDGEVVGRKFKRLKKGETGGGDGGTGANRPPTFAPSARSNTTGSRVDFLLTATDPDGDTAFTYTGSNLPAGLTLASNGRITGKITEPVGSKEVTVTVSDGKTGGATVKTFTWTISVNTVPNITTIPNQNDNVNQVISLQVVATDSAGEDLTYSALNLPQGLTINPSTGLISGTITGGTGTYNVAVLVTDGTSVGSTKSFTWTVNSL